MAGAEEHGQGCCASGRQKCARERAFHPVRDYLNALQWDGTPRLATWLNVYPGAEPNEYHARIGTHVPDLDGGAHLRARLQGRLHDRARRAAGRS